MSARCNSNGLGSLPRKSESRNASGWDTVPRGKVIGIFQHGGLGKPHALGVLTLLVLALAWIAGHMRLFGRAGRYVEVVALSATFCFHMIPGVTETFPRLPARHPVFSSPDDPALAAVAGIFFVAFLAFQVGATLRVLRLRPDLSVPWTRNG